MLQNFSFVLDGVLAGCARPGMWGALPDDLQEARSQGITAIVSLTEAPLPIAVLREADMRYLHLPVVDFTPPALEQIEEFVRFVDSVREEGGAVLVHCFAGQGRTGTLLAAYLVKNGLTAKEAISRVREIRPGSIENKSQERMVHRFSAAYRKAKD